MRIINNNKGCYCAVVQPSMTMK
ncbi:hypothetical protein ELY15_05450 [Legionella sp. km772]|nr:hypothetical protein ELY15_05450 [Legionella sp. km772]